MKRKVGTYLTVLAMVVGLCGCGAKAKPEVLLIVKVPTMGMNRVNNSNIVSCQDFMDYATEKFVAVYEAADVSMRVEAFDYVDENETTLGAYGTEGAVDILYEGYFNMAVYISKEYVVPLDDIITDEIRGGINELAQAQSMKNEKTYMMPYPSMQNTLVCNRCLFMEYGLERLLPDELEIQNWTIEKWEATLDILAEKLPDGSCPTMMYGVNNQGDTHIMSLIRAFGSGIFNEDGNFDSESKEAVRDLEWIQGGARRGWYPPYPENIRPADNQQLLENGLLGIYLLNNANFMLYDDIETDYGYVDFSGNVGQITMLAEFSAGEANVVDSMNNNPNRQGSENSVHNVFWLNIHKPLTGKTAPKECAAGLSRDCSATIHVKTSFHKWLARRCDNPVWDMFDSLSCTTKMLEMQREYSLLPCFLEYGRMEKLKQQI